MTANEIALLQAVGGENDGLSRQLGRFVNSVAPFNLTGMNIRLIWRRDRYLRASDHVSFQGQGYAAARFTEPRENFNHEHQNIQVVNGVQFGDLIEFVDFDYIARVTGVNAAALWALASSPSTPKNAQIHTTPPGTFSGTNLTTLHWDANPETNLTGYEVVMRETTASDWTRGDPRRQRHLGHARHLQGQRAVRHSCRGPEREPQPGCLPACGGLAARRARDDPGDHGCLRLSRGQPLRPAWVSARRPTAYSGRKSAPLPTGARRPAATS